MRLSRDKGVAEKGSDGTRCPDHAVALQTMIKVGSTTVTMVAAEVNFTARSGPLSRLMDAAICFGMKVAVLTGADLFTPPPA